MRLKIAAAVSIQLAVAWSTVLHAQPGPNSIGAGLHPGSSPSVLVDPAAQRCLSMAAIRTRPGDDSFQTQVEKAAMLFDVPVVLDAVAICRQALSSHRSDRRVIIAENNASFVLSVITIGIKFPDSDEEALLLALKSAEDKSNLEGISGQAVGFYLGSAYEYGIGAAPDRAAAMKWYAVGAQAGDPISKRELARLQGAKP